MILRHERGKHVPLFGRIRSCRRTDLSLKDLYSSANETANLIQVQWREMELAQHRVDAGMNVWSTVDQCAVKIENDRAGGQAHIHAAFHFIEHPIEGICSSGPFPVTEI